MTMLLILSISLCAFALCHYYWIPAIERLLRSESFTRSMRYGSVLSVVGVVRGILLINVVTIAALALILTILRMVGGTTQASATSAVNTIEQWRFWLVAFGPWWGAGVLIIVAGALGLYAAHRGKRRFGPAYKQAFEQELKRLEREREEGLLEDLPPTREMERLQSRIEELKRELVKVNWDSSNKNRVAARRKLTARLQRLTGRYDRLDIQRRTSLTLPRAEAELHAPRTRGEKMQAFLLSRGLLTSLGKGSRLLFLASLILLVPFLISIYATNTESVLNARLVELHDFRARLNAQEWEAIRQQLGPPTNELSEGDKQVIGEVARAFEEAVPIPPPTAAALKDWYMMHSSTVRQEILERAVRRSQTPLEQSHSGSRIGSLDDRERQTVALYENVVSSAGPSTQLGKEIYLKLEDAARRSPPLMEKIRTSASNIRRPAGIHALRRATLTRIMGNLTAASTGEIGNLAWAIDPKVNRPLYSLAQQDRARIFIAGLVGGRDVTEALHNVGTVQSPHYQGSPFDSAEYKSLMQSFADRLPVDRVGVKLSEYPPSIEAPPEKDVDLKTAATKVEELIQNSKGPNRERKVVAYADSLAWYRDYFPGQLGENLQTERSRIHLLLASQMPRTDVIDGPGTGRGPGGMQNTFQRARNFNSLRGYSRIGGVLIGREPSDLQTAKLSCTDLEWEIEGRSVRLILMTADGRRFRSRPHPMTLVYQAINYAADGRPVAATMVNADPLSELKVLLHPTLVDTPLGQRMIELDTFVGFYLPNEDTRRDIAQTRVHAQNKLYVYAWAYRLLAALSEGSLNSEWDLYVRGIVNDRDTQESAQKALDEAHLLSDPMHSPLTVKKEFFDSTLVDLILKNARKGMTAEQFGQAIKEQAIVQYKQASATPLKLQKLLDRWQQPTPGFQSWTGVREKEFTTDPASFMILDGSSVPMPFDFLLQVAFTTPPGFVESQQSENYSDAQPWEYPSLKEYIQDKVLNGIQNEEQDRERTILNDASEFAILQRMFRMAFNGQLGLDFPVEKLVALSEVTSAGAPKTLTRTLRWHDFHRSWASDDEPTARLAKDIRLALGVSKDEEERKRVYNSPLPALDR
jgi:hypothetical protein